MIIRVFRPTIHPGYVTVWEDVESIRAFAGERWQHAVITPDEEHLLKETWIGHYEVLNASTGLRSGG